MLRWDDVTSLHLEVSAMCNAVCPGCRRYPVNGYDVLPFLENNIQWTLEQVKNFFPANKLSNINGILFNGNHGDIVTCKESLEIVEYFIQNTNESCLVEIHTNGSARSRQWWERLASIGKDRLSVLFALDGLEDTHHLYRRETSWEKIIENAKIFSAAGGNAVWQMIVFDHNKHQVESCRELAKELGFKKFTLRYNSRGRILALDKNRNPSHWVTDVTGTVAFGKNLTNLYGDRIIGLSDSAIAEAQQNRVIAIQNETYKANQLTTIGDEPGFSKTLCTSLNKNSVFVSAGWIVSPCCHVSGELEIGPAGSRFYDDLIKSMKDNDLTPEDITASEKLTVPDIVNLGRLDWILNRVETNALVLCQKRCNTPIGYRLQFKTRDTLNFS